MSYFSCIISKKDDGKSLKAYLESFFLAKNKINYLIDNSCVVVNGEIIKNRAYLLNTNDEINIDTSIYDGIDYPPLRYNLKILYEDDYMLIVEKPSGVIIYSENKELENTMANYVAYYYTKTNQNLAIRHVHRLDIDTTGCLVYAKNVLIHSILSNYFENNKTKKEYFALVYGIINNEGKIDKKIGRNRHESGKMMVSNMGKDALTYFKPHTILKDKTLVNVCLKTGRTHQIRVHLSSIKHPLLGDKLYGKKDSYSRVMLHCYHIGFVHPITNIWIDFYADLPKDMKKIINEEK